MPPPFFFGLRAPLLHPLPPPLTPPRRRDAPAQVLRGPVPRGVRVEAEAQADAQGTERGEPWVPLPPPGKSALGGKFAVSPFHGPKMSSWPGKLLQKQSRYTGAHYLFTARTGHSGPPPAIGPQAGQSIFDRTNLQDTRGDIMGPRNLTARIAEMGDFFNSLVFFFAFSPQVLERSTCGVAEVGVGGRGGGLKEPRREARKVVPSISGFFLVCA